MNKHRDSEANEDFRNHNGSVTSMVGMICNALLFTIKFVIGNITHSVAITGDAFNNLSDASVSFLALIGFKKSVKKGDDAHPYGFGRVEYIFGLAVSFLIFFTAIEIGKTSFYQLLHPEQITYNSVILALLIFTILVKLFLGVYSRYAAQKNHSSLLKAISYDSFADAVLSTVVVLSMLVSNHISFPIDGVTGLVTALWIFISGCNLAEENLNRLIGQKPDSELTGKIGTILSVSDCFKSYHHLLIHDYGASKCFASVHVEVPADCDFTKVYAAIEKASKQTYEDLNIELAIHIHCAEGNKNEDIPNPHQ
jgi:cation diffusion facilitator family transporter